jgi:2-polyprenyl-3-methyl-5-hydroxy-6-metoxy-1,4-benzoquinol methylase
MKNLVQAAVSKCGFEIRRKGIASESEVARQAFRSDYYLRGDARRLEHLASLQIPVSGMTVLEVGAGIGDHTSYYLDRGCKVTITEPREANIKILSLLYPEETVLCLDLEHPQELPGAPFDVVHCYGTLYHLASLHPRSPSLPKSAVACFSLKLAFLLDRVNL